MLTLRPVQLTDDLFLFELFCSIWISSFTGLGWSEQQLDVILKMQFQAQRTDYQRRFSQAIQTIILLDGLPVGQLYVARNQQEIRLLDITVAEKYRNAGIGSAILTQLITEAQQTDKKISHTVLKTNLSALRFYKRHGFVVWEDAGTHLLMSYENSPLN